MKTRLVLMMLAILPLAVACTGPSTAPGATAPAAADTAAAQPVPATAPNADAATAATAEAASANPAEASTAPTPAGPIVPPAGPVPVAGVDYDVIANGKPFAALNGKIEVVEVFGYICPACAAFQPLVMSWRQKLPADVRLSYVPVAFGPEWQPYAQAFYAAEAKGLVERSHDAVFTKIHVERSLPGEGQKSDPAKVAASYAGYGVDAKEFLGLMNSFGVNAKINRGKQFAMQSGVTGTPTLIVNGKYRIKGRSFDDMLRIADHLIAQERVAQGLTAQ